MVWHVSHHRRRKHSKHRRRSSKHRSHVKHKRIGHRGRVRVINAPRHMW